MPEKISRRDFIIKSAAGIVIGGTVLSVLDLNNLFAVSTKGNISKVSDDIVIKLSDPKNADLKKINGSILLDDENILVRISQTQFLAVNLICKHKGCTVDLTGNQFICPCHGSEYDITGKVTHGPSKANLTTWPTSYDSEKGIVTVQLGKVDDSGKELLTDSTKTDTTKFK